MLLMTLLVISPHLDDAVFSCGMLLAASPGAVVCTVFAGLPREPHVTDWDKHCGFADAHQAMRTRHQEDAAALDALGAQPLLLDFLDSQYAALEGEATVDELTQALANVIRDIKPDTLYIPLGLFHSDHALTYEACLNVWLMDTSLTCIGYEEGLYRRMDGLVQNRLDDLKRRALVATPLLPPLDPLALARNLDRKRLAVSRYTSQLKAFGPDGYDDVSTAERAWTLQPKGRDDE
jgi:LmbE family N-acetylglucosaminyl deacetylase